jgi:CheY-like chemotaxis protein
MHILLIDDEGPLVDVLATRLLVAAHHTSDTIYIVEDEESLKGQLEQFQPEAVILDFGMDGEGESEGDTVYRWIRKWRRDIKIIFYTCYAETAEPRAKMLAAGATEREIVRKNGVGNDIPQLLMVLAA